MGDTKQLVKQAGIEAKSLRHSGFYQAADVIEKLAAITAHLEQQLRELVELIGYEDYETAIKDLTGE